MSGRAPRGVRLAGAILAVPAFLLPATASATPASSVGLSNVHLSAVWNEGWLTGNLHFTVTVSGAANVQASVRPVSSGPVAAVKHYAFTKSGAVAETIKLPARLPPKDYVLKVGSQTAKFTVPTPAEGIVDNAVVSTSQGGKSTKAVPSSTHILWVRFHFLVAPPGSKNVKIEWRTPSFTFIGAVTKPYATTIDSDLKSNVALPKGTWYATLVVDGKVAKRQDVRVT
ncbi:MAG TPA: hypothetical protein VH063_13425 [Gaiellaceae bacterium]|jgi:hypothetical protein|nr:hypothetical protein [Gaiellaceae bacterium]